MTVSQFQCGKRQRARRGVSLIEVLVVLVILVTGILTIIRLFPSGFFSIQSTGNAALADSLGGAAINLGRQNADSLPEAILPDDLAMDDLGAAVTNSAAYSNYDPDDPNNLENARVVQNETVRVPTAVNGQSVYVVNYGPVVMPADPTQTAAQLPNFFTVSSPYWTASSGNSAPSTNVSSVAGAAAVPVDIPQDTLVPGHEQFLVDLTRKMIAVPYAAYTLDGTTSATSGSPSITVQNANSYAQKIVVVITCYDTSSGAYTTYTRYLDVPAGTPRNGSNPYAPFGLNNQTYLADVPATAGMPGTGSYQGGWFDPTADYQDSPSGQTVPNLPWVSVALYRPYTGIANNVNTTFSNDPYEFKLTAANIVTTAATANTPATGANPGAIAFNPKAATGSGELARKVQISYIVFSWSILREDHDIPALTGGDTFVVRTTVPNLLLAGSANPDNSINTGIAGSNDSLVIMDLDTGKIVAPGGVADPTNPDSPINNEDLNGTSPGPSNNYINVSYALGRLTFGSNAFGDNSQANGTGHAPAHRIRIFYTADLNWTVAVQKAPAYFTQVTPSGGVSGTTPLGAAKFAYDGTQSLVYFARCNAGKTVEIDGTYTLNGKTQSFSDTIAVSPILNTVGDSNVSVNLGDSNTFANPVPAGAAVTFSAVRGLSARAVVAWKERNQYKVHTVDAVLNRTP